MRHFTFALLLPLALCAAADCQVLFPADAKPIGPYSPGIRVGDTVYVSGQGSRDPRTGQHPASFDAQVRQTMENIRSTLKSGRLDLKNLAYCHVYLDDFNNYATATRVFRSYFKKDPPAGTVLGLAGMPGGTHVEVTCVASAGQRKAVWPPKVSRRGQTFSPGMLTAERLYVSGQRPNTPTADYATQVREALENMGRVLKAAGLGFPNMVFVNPYLVRREGARAFNKVYASFFEFGNTPARATISVVKLPNDAPIEFTGVAVRDLSKRRSVRPANMKPSPTASPCVFAGDTFYCSAKSGFIPSGGIRVPDVEGQLKQTMRNLLDGLEEAGLTWNDVVETHVYLDDMADYAKMNALYATYFGKTPPTRTTLQQIPSLGAARTAGGPGKYPTLEQISLVAVRRH
ncbi:MAG TPA: RidA family protein [Bryobacterales bacterium]|nr:RidA family protein [Bryobacterales bacterium]